MRKSWISVLAGLPLIVGAGMPPSRPLPRPPVITAPEAAAMPDVVQVNLLDRFLQDSGARGHGSSTRHRSNRQSPGPTRQTQNSKQTPPVPATVPVPIPKPAIEAENPAKPPPVSAAQTAPETPPRPDAATVEKPTAADIPAKPPATEPSPDVAPPTARGPVVEQPGTATEPAHQAEVPKPLAKPADAPPTPAGGENTVTPDAAGKAGAGRADAKPGDANRDGSSQDAATPDEPKSDGKDKDAQDAEKPASPTPPPLVKEDPEELKACLADLATIGAKFATTDPIDDGDGCGIEHPIDVAEVLPGVTLGGATMRCKTALTMAHWLKDTVQPAINIAMPGRRIVSLVPGSTYACRLRNSAATGKISEHARGNAFDVAAFKLDDGKTMEMKPRDEDSTLEGAFQRTVTAGACLHFTTVLSPGSDAAHETHLHLDVLDRKGGYRYCR